MKISCYLRFFPLTAFLGLCGCAAPPDIAPAPTPISTPASPPAAPLEAPVEIAPTAAPRVIQSGRSSLPTLPQMMDNSPRPTYVPLPTPKVRPGETIGISNARPTPTPRENPTIIVSNAPIPGTSIAVSAAAAQGLVWIKTKPREGIYYRPGERFYGGTVDGYYTTETQARARGYRAALR